MKNAFLFFWEIAKIIVIAFLIVAPIRYFVFQPFFVKGQSMDPNFHNGDYLIIDELSYRFREPQRGEVIVFKYPRNPSERYIKRIIGLPGEIVGVQDGKVNVYSEKGVPQIITESVYLSESVLTAGDLEIRLGQDEYFVLGDNRPFSSDSRSWGTLTSKNIIGKVFLRAWPLKALAKVAAPAY